MRSAESLVFIATCSWKRISITVMMADSEIAFGHRKFAVGTIAKLDSTCSTSCMGTPKFFAVLGLWLDF